MKELGWLQAQCPMDFSVPPRPVTQIHSKEAPCGQLLSPQVSPLNFLGKDSTTKSLSLFSCIPFLAGNLTMKSKQLSQFKEGGLQFWILVYWEFTVERQVRSFQAEEANPKMQTEQRVILSEVCWEGLIGLEKWAPDSEGP